MDLPGACCVCLLTGDSGRDASPRTRGLGLGRILVERQLASLRARDVPGVYLDVAADNANAIAFYEHLGFAAVHRLDTSILMARRLT
jgi:ribosomal protein S18 acetylase RimI-like enzyme